jgi:hypothetical protein
MEDTDAAKRLHIHVDLGADVFAATGNRDGRRCIKSASSLH